MSGVVKMEHNVPAQNETDAISRAADEGAGFEKLLKFKKGEYFCDGEVVPMGTKYVAHCVGWTKIWIKFVNQEVMDRKMFPVRDGRKWPDREQLDAQDQSQWEIGINNQPADPWVFQDALPMENPDTGEVAIFITSSFGGKRAVSDLCRAYARRAVRGGKPEQPIIEVRMVKMPTKRFGDVPRPNFTIVGWTGDEGGGVREINATNIKADMDDEIPF